MKYLYCLAASVFSCMSASAQFGFGPLVGLNISDYTQRVDDKKVKNQVKLGWRIGVLFEKGLSERLYLQPGLNYVTNGYKGKSFGADILYIINTVELPVNLEYKLGDSCSNHIFFGGGPYVGWNKGGMLHIKNGINVDSRRDLYVGSAISDDVKRWDVGFGLNVGYEFNHALIARVHYQMGFLNLEPAGNDANKLHNYNCGLSIAYLFHTKPKEKHKTKDKEDKTKEKFKSRQ